MRPLRLVLLGYQIVAALLGLFLMVRAIPEMRRVLAQTIPWDLNIDRLTARAYVDGYSPYTPEGAVRSGAAASGPAGNGHPPTTSFWVLPLATLDQASATMAMGTVVLFVLFLQLVATLRIVRAPAVFATAWLAWGYILGCDFMLYHLSLGQWSGIIGFFYAVGWWAAREGDDWLAGLALGSACTLKLFPGVVVLLFLVLRRWRVLAGASVTYLAIAAMMTARFGLASWPRFLAQQSAIANLWMGSIQNQSLHGIIQRVFRPVCVPQGPVIPRALLLSSGLSAVLIGASLWWARRGARPGARFDLTYALLVVVSVVTSQWTWEHYSVIYVLPITLLAASAVRSLRPGPRTARVWAALELTALAGIIASWRIDTTIKMQLQTSVQGGSKADHLRLHVYDLLNWAPGLVLLLLLMAEVARRHHGAAPDSRRGAARRSVGQEAQGRA